MPHVQGYDFPDDATQDEINEALRQYAPPSAPAAAPPAATPVAAPAPTADPGTAALAASGYRPGSGYGLQDAIVRGMTFGLSDPVGAFGTASAGGPPLSIDTAGGFPWVREAPGFSERYQRALKQAQDAAAQYQADSPILSRAAPLIGMLATAAPNAGAQAMGFGRRLAQGLGFGTAGGAAEAVPQATQEPTWGRAGTDVGLGDAIGAGGTGASSLVGPTVGAGIPAMVRGAPVAIGSAIGAHLPFLGAEIGGPWLGKEVLGPLAEAAMPTARRIGAGIQRLIPSPRTLSAGPAALIAHLMPGQPTGGLQPGQ